MVPGLFIKARRTELDPARLLLVGAELVRIADLHRHVLAAGVFLHVGSIGERLEDILAGGDDTVDVAGVKLARRKAADLDKDALRGLADSLKAKVGSGVVVIASAIFFDIHTGEKLNAVEVNKTVDASCSGRLG